MDIVVATSEDLYDYNKIYVEYVYDQLKYSGDNATDLKNIYDNYDFLKRNKAYIESNDTLVLIVKKGNTIVGFIEYNISYGDCLFENKHLYVSNLYFTDEIRLKKIVFPLAKKINDMAEEWCKQKGIAYICNDILADNVTMKYVNRLMGFSEYKVRYVKRL